MGCYGSVYKKGGNKLTSTLGTWRPIVFNVLICMNND